MHWLIKGSAVYRLSEIKIACAYLSLRKSQQFLWQAVQNEWPL